MEIEYLKNLKNTYNSTTKLDRIGVSELEISNLEINLNLRLPKAYKEFLFIAGKRDSIIRDWNRGFDHLEGIQEEAEESFNNVNLNLKSFFAFAEYARDQFLFFFLNEGENPPVYIFAEEKFHKNNKGEYVYYKKTDETFSSCIDDLIKDAIK